MKSPFIQPGPFSMQGNVFSQQGSPIRLGQGGGPYYDFRDEFSTVLASASLNNSACTPGPGNRTATDTETCMSIIPNYGSSLADQTGVTFGGSNNRCSYADGYAWIDFPTGFNAAAHAGQGRIVVMYDSAGRAAWGFLGAAGTGETFGNELVDTWGNDGYETLTLSGSDITSAINTNASYARAYKQVSLTTEKLVKFIVGSYTLNSGANPKIVIGTNISTLPISAGTVSVSTLTGSGSYYGVIQSGAFLGFRTEPENTNYSATGNVVKQVLTPSSTGVLIYRDAACTVNGWHKPTAFNMNDSSYTFNIYQPTSGGRLFIQGGKATAAQGDPGLWDTTAITRTAGLICAFKVNPKDISKVLEVGLDTDKTGALAANALRISSSTVIPYNSGSAGPVIAIPTNATEHIMAIVLRAVGAKYFMKVGSGYFKKLWESSTNNTATLYRGISNYSLTGKVDFLRQSKTLWMDTPLLSDSFTGTAGTNDGRVSDGLGHAETTGLGSGGAGVAWSGSSGAVDGSGRLVITPTLGDELATGNLVVGNWYYITATEANHFGTGLGVGYTFRATTTTALDALNKVKQITLSTCYNTVTLLTKDTTVECAFQMTTGKSAGLIVGLNEAGTSFILIRHDGNGNIMLAICESGTYTSKASVAKAYSSDASLIIRRDDTVVWCWYADTLIGSGPTTTLSAGENTNLAGLRVGAFSTSELNSFAFIKAYSTGTNNEFARLDYLVGN